MSTVQGIRAVLDKLDFFLLRLLSFLSKHLLSSRPTAFLPPRARKAAAWGGAAAAVPSRAGKEQGPSEERELGPRLPLLQVSAAAAGSICRELIPLSLRCSGERSSSTFPAD